MHLDDLVAVELEDFHVLECLPVDNHSDEGDLFVESRIACRSRIDVEEIQLLVVNHL